ncbi:MAG: CHAT domain-containing protein [Cytophagales bacterium]|nr:CHAT domain-containing protein [Cytophagales bacterium]
MINHQTIGELRSTKYEVRNSSFFILHLSFVFRNLFILLLLLAKFSDSQCQNNYKETKKIRKALAKMERNFARGDYKIALSISDNLINPLEEVSIIDDNAAALLAQIYLSQAKYLTALGNFSQAKEKMIKGLEILTQREKSPLRGDLGGLYYKGLIQATEMYLLAHNYRKAGTQIIKIINTDLNTDLRDKIKFLAVKINYHKGNLNEASEVIADIIAYRESKVVKKIQVKDPKSGEMKWKKLATKQLKQRKRAFAAALNLSGNIYRKKGDYQKSDSILNTANIWISKNLNKKDISYVDNLHAMAQLYDDQEQHSTAAKLYQKAIKASDKKAGLRYKNSHVTYLDIHEHWVRSYINNNEYSKAKTVLNRLLPRIALYYSKDNFHFVKIRRLDAEISMSRGNLSKAESELEELLNFNGLPSLPPEYSGGSQLRSEKHRQPRLADKTSDRTAMLPGDYLELSKVYYLLYEIYLKTDRFKKAGDCLKKLLEIGNNIYGNDAPDYHITKLRQADFFVNYTSEFKKAEKIYNTSFFKTIDKQLHPHHKDYITFLNHISKLYELMEKYSLAKDNLNTACEIAFNKYGSVDIHYVAQLEKLASLYIKTGEYKKAENYIGTALNHLKSITGQLSIEHSKVLETLARLYTVMGKYDEAEKTLNLSSKIAKSTDNKRVLMTQNIDDLTALYLKTGRYFQTEKLLKEAIEQREMIYGESHLSLINPINLLGNLYLITGNYNESEKLLNRGTNLASKIVGDTSVKYTEGLKHLSRLYSRMGDYDKAETMAQHVLDIQTKKLGRDHAAIADALTDLALVRFYKGQETAKIKALLEEALAIVRNNFGESHPQYAEALRNLALLHIENNNFARALDLLNFANQIWIQKLGEKNIHSADISLLKGAIFTEKRDFKNAESNYVSAKSYYRKTFNKYHPDYANSLSKLSQMYYISGKAKKAVKILDETTDIYLTFIKKYFPSLSDREKTKFWNHIKSDFEFYKTLAIKFREENPKLICNVYNHTLAIKAILLNASIKVRERILNSGDTELIGKYKEWVSKKEFLTGILSLSNQELKESGIDANSLLKETDFLEKYLNESSGLFAANYESVNYTWKDVRDNLNENEVAIEIVRFRYFDKSFTDSILYAALIVSPQTKKNPGLVIFENGKQLETRYLKFYRNSIKFRAEDKNSYQVFWEPIKNKIEKTQNTQIENVTVYLSADGVYNQVNLETMSSSTGDYVIDENNIVLVSNTKDIILNKFKHPPPPLNKEDDSIVYPTAPSTAALFGNPNFFVNANSTKDSILANTITKGDFIVATFSQLPGAEREVKELSKLLRSKDWQTGSYLNYAATEQRVKNLKSPRILHFATHGFFMSDIEQFSGTGITEISENKSIENPLLRSGLLLSGGGDLLNSKTNYDFNTKNGILTAWEAMNLDLDNTELVVLSACETGLGEIQTGEGVYGLQRAFLVAGANTVMMSLFKVSDEIIPELMKIFYTKWLNTGDKRQAFIEAKKEIRKKYKDPYYWGGFVMIGLD